MDKYVVRGLYEDRHVFDTETKEELWENRCADELNRLTARVAELESANEKQEAQLVDADVNESLLEDRIAELEAFKGAVLGWRENDHPEGFCRFSAEYVADLGRQALNRGRDDE